MFSSPSLNPDFLAFVVPYWLLNWTFKVNPDLNLFVIRSKWDNCLHQIWCEFVGVSFTQFSELQSYFHDNFTLFCWGIGLPILNITTKMSTSTKNRGKIDSPKSRKLSGFFMDCSYSNFWRKKIVKLIWIYSELSFFLL